jgi:tetratricopeptide (TPR) repeat protein
LSTTGGGIADPAALEALRATARECEAAGRHAEAAQAWEQLAAGLHGPTRAPALVQQARLLSGPLEQPAEAERLYRRALASDPGNREALDALAERARSQANWHLLANLQHRDFEAAGDPLKQAKIALAAGQLELEHLENQGAAKAWYRRGLQCHAENLALLEALADLERRSANDAALLECVERIIELQGDRASPAALLEVASLRSDLGEHARALACLQRASSIAPEDTLVLDALAETLGQLDRCGDLADVLERRAALAVDDPRTRAGLLVELGNLLEERLFDPEAALDAFDRAHAADPDARGVAEGRTRLRAKLEADQDGADAGGEPHKAASAGKADLASALRAYEREAQVTTDRARLGILVREIERLNQRRGTAEEALPWVQRWVVAAPEEPEALHALARLHERPGHEGELTATLEALDPLLERREQVENRRRLGVLFARRGMPEESARAFQAAVDLDPTDVDALDGLVAVLRELDRTAELVVAQTRMADQLEQPRRARCLHEVAQLQEEIGDLAGAIETVARLEREESPDERIAERLDTLLERAGRFEELETRLLTRRDESEPASAEAVALELRNAQLLESLSRDEEAAEAFRRVLAHAPESREATAGLERVLRSSIDASGLADYLAHQALTSEDPVARDRASLERAVILEELLDRSQEARETYEQLARAAADAELRLDASRRYERLLENAGEWNALRQHLESALGRASEDEDERVHERLARLCAHRLRDEAAEVSHLERIVEINPARADVWRLLAERYEQDDRADDLTRALEAELEAGTDHARELSLRGRLAGIYAELIGDHEQAQEQYERVFELSPSHMAAAQYLIERYQMSNRPEPLLHVLEGRLAALEAARPEKRATTASERTAVRVQIARVREAQLDDLEGAISALEVALGDAGPSSLVTAPLADCYQRAGYTLDLIELCRTAAASCDDPEERANWLVRLGDAFLSRELARNAADAYRQALTERPNDRAVQASLRELYRQGGDSDSLARLLEAELTHLAGPDEIPVRLELAELLDAKLERPEDALLHARRVLQVDPHHPAAFDRALALSERLGHHTIALELIEARLENARTNAERAELLAHRGKLLEGELNQPDRAAADYRLALELDPMRGELRRDLAALLERHEHWSDLLDCLEQELRGALGESRVAILERAAEIAWKHISPDVALPWLERLRRARPDDASAVARVAVAHRRAGRIEPQLRALEEQAALVSDGAQRRVLQLERAALLESDLAAPGRALAVLQAAAEDSPRDEEILRHIERLQRALCHHTERAATLETLLAISPSDPIDLQRQLAELCDTHLGDPQRAAEHWQAALDLLPAGSAARIEILHTLAESHRKAGRLEDWAQRSEEELASLDQTPVFDDRRRELRRELALAYDAKLAKRGEALRHLRALLDAGDAELLGAEVRDRLEHMCLRLLRRADDPTELEARLATYLERNDGDTARWLEIARLREERLHASAAALDAYRRTLELDPEHLDALRGMRRTAERLGRWADVADALERELAHGEIQAPEMRSSLLRRLGDVCWHRLQSTTQASRFYAAALEVNAADFASLRALERLLESMEDWRGALDLYESEIEVLGADDACRRRELWLRVAVLARDHTDDVGRALRAFEKAEELEPLDTARLLEFAELHDRAGDREAFAETFASWCDAADADASCADHVRLAECLEALDRSEEALARIDRGLAVDADFAPAWDAAARLREAAADETGSADALRRAAALSVDNDATPRLLRAAQLLEAHDADAALALLRNAAERDPTAAGVHAARSHLAAAQELDEEAEASAAQALALAPDALGRDERIEVSLLGGAAARATGRLEAAASFFARALEEAPDDDRITSAYGETLAALGDHTAARSALETRLARGDVYPERAQHRSILASCHEAEGALETALENFEAALEDDPALEEALAGAVRVREAMGDVDAGVAAIERWARAADAGELRGQRLLQAAEWELRVGRRASSAEHHLRDALAANPRMPRAWIDLVELLLEADRLDEAIEAADRSALYLEDDAQLGSLALLQARAYEQRGAQPQAAESFGVAAEADPRCIEAALAQARLLRGFGEWRSAAETLERFAEHHPDPDAAELAEVHAQLGRLLAGPLEEVDGAVAHYRRAVTLAPAQLEARVALAELLSHRPSEWDDALQHQRLLLDADPTDAAVLRVALRIARGREDEAAIAQGVHILRALGVASAYETESSDAAAVPPRKRSEATLDDPLQERLRHLAQEAAREIATALETPGEPEPPSSDDPEAAFRAAALMVEGQLTAPALLPLPTREVADLLVLIATLVLDPEQVRGDGRRLNALSSALGRRRRRRLTRILEGTSLDAIRSIDFDVWRSEVRALASWQALRESNQELRTALVALVRESPEAPDADLREGADLTALVRGDPTARALLRRVVSEWIGPI